MSNLEKCLNITKKVNKQRESFLVTFLRDNDDKLTNEGFALHWGVLHVKTHIRISSPREELYLPELKKRASQKILDYYIMWEKKCKEQLNKNAVFVHYYSNKNSSWAYKYCDRLKLFKTLGEAEKEYNSQQKLIEEMTLIENHLEIGEFKCSYCGKKDKLENKIDEKIFYRDRNSFGIVFSNYKIKTFCSKGCAQYCQMGYEG